MTTPNDPIRSREEKERIWANFHAGMKLVKEGRSAEGHARAFHSSPAMTFRDLHWVREGLERQDRIFEAVQAWGDPKKDGNKTIDQILLREARRGNVEAQEMLASLPTLLPAAAAFGRN
jgi:hypothetical protein